MAKKSVCIMCGNARDGIEVRDDFVLDSVRWFKRNVTHNEQGNRLVVCRECYPKHKEAFRKQQDRQRLYVGLGAAFAVVSLLVSPHLETLAIAVALVACLYLLSLLNYVPGLKMEK